jgi:hypothetical protein
MSRCRLVSASERTGGRVRFIGLDVHRAFCEMAIAVDGVVSAGWANRFDARRP